MHSKLKSETFFSWLIFYYMYNNADFFDVSSWGQEQLSFTRCKFATNLTLNQLKEVIAKEKNITEVTKENQSLSSQARSSSSWNQTWVLTTELVVNFYHS